MNKRKLFRLLPFILFGWSFAWVGDVYGESVKLSGGPNWAVVPIVFKRSTTGWGGGFQYLHRDLFGPESYFRQTTIASQNKDYLVSFKGERRHIGSVAYAFTELGYSHFRANPTYGFGNESSKSSLQYFSEKKVFGEAGIGFHLGPYIRLGLSYDFEHNRPREALSKYSPSVTNTFIGFGDTIHAHLLKALLEWDSRDHLFLPTRGTKITIQYSNSRPFKKSTYRFHQWSFEGIYLYPLLEQKLILASRAQYVITNTDESLPLIHRASLGGFDSLRAHPHRRYVDSKSLLLNIELRWFLWTGSEGSLLTRIEFAAFGDAGRVYARTGESFTLKGLHPDAGLGIRMGIGPGILRGDYATNFNGDSLFGVGFHYPF